jgi:hypothetical protein
MKSWYLATAGNGYTGPFCINGKIIHVPERSRVLSLSYCLPVLQLHAGTAFAESLLTEGVLFH